MTRFFASINFKPSSNDAVAMQKCQRSLKANIQDVKKLSENIVRSDSRDQNETKMKNK